MNKKTVLTILESIEDDISQTHKDILEGKPYQSYFQDVVKARWEFLKYANENLNCNFDVDGAIKIDKEKYADVLGG